MAHLCEWPGCGHVVKADWRPFCYRHWLELTTMSDQEPADQEQASTPSQRPESRNPAPAPSIDFGAEIRRALDSMIESGEIEFGTETPSSQPARPSAPPAPQEDDETRFERWLEARENRSRRDQEEKAFRERVTKSLDRKPRWFEPWRP